MAPSFIKFMRFSSVAMFFALAATSQAQIIFQAPSPVTQTPSDISTLGTYIDAVGRNDGAATVTVGSTVFNQIFSDPGITLSSNIGPGSDGSGSDATPFQMVLNGVAYTGDFNPGDNITGTVTLHNLAFGNLYQVQVFSVGGFVTQVIGANTQAINNQSTIGIFTATSSTQTFALGATLSGVAEVNAISLRDITTVPEPSTYAMLALGATGLCLLVRGCKFVS